MIESIKILDSRFRLVNYRYLGSRIHGIKYFRRTLMNLDEIILANNILWF